LVKVTALIPGQTVVWRPVSATGAVDPFPGRMA